MATAILSPSRVLRRPRRVDLRAVFGLLLLLVAIAGSVAFWSASSATQAVVVATRELPAGATLSASDLAVARVRVDGAIYQRTVPATGLGNLVGKQVTEPLHVDQILVWPQLSSHLPLAQDQMAFTVPVTADTAAGGRIRPGDVVEVLVTTGKGMSTSRSAVVLARVSVYDVGYGGTTTTINASGSAVTGGSSTGGAISWLTLIVTQKQALQLAQAKWAGQLDVALRPGS
jgi:Flp pilus assembly protein CpaB